MPFNDLGAIGQWNPATNSPKLVSGKGQGGMIYRCSTAGNLALDGNTEWNQNDLVAFNDQMGQWFRLGPSNIASDSEVLLGQDNQKILTSKHVKWAIEAYGFVNVKNYGAKGDNVTDDTAAIQAAIAAAAGKVLLFPAGTYRVTQLVPVSSTIWYGEAMASCVISRLGSAENDMITATSAGWVSFQNLTFSGGDVVTAIPTGTLAFNLCTHFTFTNCYFDKFYKIALASQGSTFFLVDNCWFNRTTSSHIANNQAINNGVATGPSNNYTVRNSWFNNSGNLIQGQSVCFEHNYCFNWGYGAGISTGLGPGHEYARIAFNFCSSATGKDADGFTLKGIENWSPYSTVIGNICNGNSGPGIFQGGKFSTIVGNVCNDNDTFGETFIGGINLAYSDATNNATGCTVSGNSCTNTGPGTQDYGCVVSALCNNVRISGNAFAGNVIGPYVVQGGSNASIQYEDWYVPLYKAADFTVGEFEKCFINGKAGSTQVVTLPNPANYPGRTLTFINWMTFTVVSASANVLPPTGGVGTAILPATAGKWADLISDGTNWIVMRFGG